jgi:DNA-binding Lrp family transcriptional regulator
MDMIRDSAFEAALIEAIGRGLPLVPRPYAVIAEHLGRSEQDVIDGIERILQRGDLKRFGVVVRHRKLGYRANGMVVWDIPDSRVTDLGERISRYPFVTLCYQRPRRPPAWPYNLFSMIHGRDREAVIGQAADIVRECGLHDNDHEILFSSRCFKQRGAAYRRGTDPQPAATEPCCRYE